VLAAVAANPSYFWASECPPHVFPSKRDPKAGVIEPIKVLGFPRVSRGSRFSSTLVDRMLPDSLEVSCQHQFVGSVSMAKMQLIAIEGRMLPTAISSQLDITHRRRRDRHLTAPPERQHR
jgi:hypothetical protein